MPANPKSTTYDTYKSMDKSDIPAGPNHHHLNVTAGSFSVTGFPLGFVVEGDPADPEGRRLESRPSSGGKVISSIDSEGSYHIHRAGSLDLGRSDEARATKVLLQAFHATGREATLIEGAEDDRGEDGRVLIDGAEYILQIVSVPADSRVWSELARVGHQSETGIFDDAIHVLRAALERKRNVADDTILVLNAAHLGAVIGPKLVQGYLGLFGDPCAEFRLREAWIVGPSLRSTIPLIGLSRLGYKTRIDRA